jgi:hypothetical protein
VIRESEFYHGAALLRVVTSFDRGVKVTRRADVGAGCYAIEDAVGIYIKYSTSRMPPWRFSFNKEQRAIIRALAQTYGTIATLLVCNDDNMVVLVGGEVDALLGKASSTARWISVRRAPRGMCALAGSAGNLKRRLPDSDMSPVHEALPECR